MRGLATGADDYVVKPFSVPELMARVQAHSAPRQSRCGRRHVAGRRYRARPRARAACTRGGREINLSPTEFRLLEYLMQSPGRVYSRAQLLDGVWGRDIYIDERTVDVHVGRLRKALIARPRADPIRTVRGMGYSFDERFTAA